MEKRNFIDPKIRAMASGALQAYSGVLDCNVCHSTITEDQEYFFTCEDTCDFDICRQCMTCPRDSQFFKAFKPYSEERRMCERCNIEKDMSELNQCVCPAEDHFVCSPCIGNF